jgi:hypothetical protein
VRARQRRQLWAVAIAAAIGFVVGWLVRFSTQATFEEKAREAAHSIQERFRRGP